MPEIGFTGTDFMKLNKKLNHIWAGMLLALFALSTLSSTGCTVIHAGVTLPNPWYTKNVPQYFPRGDEYPFANELANLQEEDKEVQRGY